MSALVVNAATACFPGISHEEAIERIVETPPREQHLGVLGHTDIQLCPQNRRGFDVERASALKHRFSDVRLRLHANVRIGDRQPVWTINDICTETLWYFQAIGVVSAALSAPCYTLHCGPRRGESSIRLGLERIAANRRRLEDLLQLPVGVEGMCAAKDWLSSWSEYRYLLDGDMRYAIDLSHLAIVAHRERVRDDGLVRELLLSDSCIEVHVSDNDGVRDRHDPIGEKPPWWWRILTEAAADGMAVTVFSEGNQLRAERSSARGGQR